MNGYAWPDAKVVLGACKLKTLDPLKYMPYEDKLSIATYTGLSLSLVAKALTNIRKGILHRES